ncbi:MAG: site-specific DNA-methyltransferase [Gammaproteobacteria bacterium]|nr:site-specific DNA-methyltransferase [Gammaproteobacteria bacterium]
MARYTILLASHHGAAQHPYRDICARVDGLGEAMARKKNNINPRTPKSAGRKSKDTSTVPLGDDDFSLESQIAPSEQAVSRSRRSAKNSSSGGRKSDNPDVLSYRHKDKRKNNPEVGMVRPENDPDEPQTVWQYDPHIDPALQFDSSRAQIERLIDDALANGDKAAMRAALEELKRHSAPYLNWTGKAERTSFEIDTVSLHVHERIDPASILAAVRKRLNEGKGKGVEKAHQPDLFAAPFENLPLRDAIDFYKHERGWTNRLIAGDSLLVMNSLLQKESMAGQVQMIYIDPPYGIKYGSNFQPFVNKRDVKDRKDEDLTQEPEMIKAFRDTWELGIHSYLTYLRDRLLLAKELLHESGSVFVQISDENVHHVRELCEEILGAENNCGTIVFQKTGWKQSDLLSVVHDNIVWFAKDRPKVKFRPIWFDKLDSKTFAGQDIWIEEASGRRTRVTKDDSIVELSETEKLFRHTSIKSAGASPTSTVAFGCYGREFHPGSGQHWKTSVQGLEKAARSNRLLAFANTLEFVSYLNDFPLSPYTNVWTDTVSSGFSEARVYVVQTLSKVIERCLLMTTDPGDLVLDPTCGSGTTAFVAEKWGRRWITCDTSRVSVTLAKQRLMTASYDYYELKYPNEGLKSGFIYKTVPHVTLKSIANNPEIDEIHERMHPTVEAALAELNKAAKQKLKEWEVPFDFSADWSEATRKPFDAFHTARKAMQKKMDDSIAAHADQETLYDQPAVSKNKLRITGPFTVEAVPFPTVLALDEAQQPQEADVAISRSGESARQHSWRDELIKTGIRGKGGQMLKFADLETLPDSPHLHVSGHLDTGERVVVSFGPEHAALEQRQVALALNEAEKLRPAPKFIIFASFEFDPEAAKDIDETKWPGVTLLKAKMNADLLTDDLKKGRTSNQSFWLMGQPDVEVHKQKDGRYVVEVHGFDYFDTAKGELVSGGKGKIAMWLLDTDYDERSLFPRQVFFPMAGKGEGWGKLKKDIRAELNEGLLEKFHGTKSVPFEAGENRKVAVKIVDDRGIESLKIIPLT